MGCHVTQLLQIRVPVCFGSGHSSDNESETQVFSSASPDGLLVFALRCDSLLRLVHATRLDAAKQGIIVLRSPRHSGGLAGFGVRPTGG